MEFLQEGYPPRVRQLASDAEAVMSGIARQWESVDKPLAGSEAQYESHVIPRAKEVSEEAKQWVEAAKADFEPYMHFAGKGSTRFAMFVVVLGAIAEVVVNYEPFKYITPTLPDWANLIGAFAVSLIYMWLCESSGGALKEGSTRRAMGFGGAAVAGLLLIAWVRGVAAQANLERLVEQGEATGIGLSGGALFLVSVGIPLLLGAGAFAVGHWNAPSHVEYIPRKRKLKAAQRRRRDAENSLRAAHGTLRAVQAQRERARKVALRKCELQVNIFSLLAMHYLETYNRAAPPNQRKALPGNRIPAEIPLELVAERKQADNPSGEPAYEAKESR